MGYIGWSFNRCIVANSGIINQFLGILELTQYILGNAKWFPYTLVITNTWKEFGYNTIVYLAINGNRSTLYEAAVVDGAGRWKQTWHITLPGILPIVTLMTVLSLGNVLNAGFDQVFNCIAPLFIARVTLLTRWYIE